MNPAQLPLPPAAGFVVTVATTAPVYHVLAVAELSALARGRVQVREDFALALAVTDAASGADRRRLRRPGARLSPAAWGRLVKAGLAKYGDRGPKLIARDERSPAGWVTHPALALPSAGWLVIAAIRSGLGYSGIARCTGWTGGFVRQVVGQLIINGWALDDGRATVANRESRGRLFALSHDGPHAQRSRGARSAGLLRGKQQTAERGARAHEARRMRDAGATNADIARALDVTARSVRSYLAESSQP